MGNNFAPTELMRDLFAALDGTGKRELAEELGYSLSHLYLMARNGRYRRVVAYAIAGYFRCPVQQLFSEIEPSAEAA